MCQSSLYPNHTSQQPPLFQTLWDDFIKWTLYRQVLVLDLLPGENFPSSRQESIKVWVGSLFGEISHYWVLLPVKTLQFYNFCYTFINFYNFIYTSSAHFLHTSFISRAYMCFVITNSIFSQCTFYLILSRNAIFVYLSCIQLPSNNNSKEFTLDVWGMQIY